MHRYGRMSVFKIEADHPVKIQEFGRVVGISQEFMGLSTVALFCSMFLLQMYIPKIHDYSHIVNPLEPGRTRMQNRGPQTTATSL